jgi:hypothetical protein
MSPMIAKHAGMPLVKFDNPEKSCRDLKVSLFL